MGQALFLELSGLAIHRSYLLKLGVKIDSYNDHRSAPFSRACWLDSAPPTLLERRSRHCHGINYTQNPVAAAHHCALGGEQTAQTCAFARLISQFRPIQL